MNVQQVTPRDPSTGRHYPKISLSPANSPSRLHNKEALEISSQFSLKKSDERNSETLFTAATIPTVGYEENSSTRSNAHDSHTTLGLSAHKSSLFEDSHLCKRIDHFRKNSPSRFQQTDASQCENTLKDICLDIESTQIDIVSHTNPQEEIPLANVGSRIAIHEEESVSGSQSAPQINLDTANQQSTVRTETTTEPAATIQPRSEQLSEIEAKLYLRRSIAFFVAMSFISLFTLVLSSRRALAKGVFIPLYIYLCYYIFENIKLRRYPQRAQWRLREDILSSIEATSAIIFFVCIHLKLKHVLPTCVIATIPIFIAAVIRLCKSIIPNKVRRRRIIITRFCYAIQALLITTKIDGYSHWGWKIVFTPLWVYFGLMMCFYVVIISIFVVKLTIFVNPRRGVNDEINSLTQFLGMFWSCLYYGLNFVAFIALSGMAKAFKPAEESFDMLRSAAFMGLYFNFILTIYTVLGFKRLSGYLRIYNLIQNALIGVGLYQEEKLVSENHRLANLVEKKECHFVMQSYTYFIPLKNVLLSQNKERLQKIKDKISSIKLAKVLRNKLKYTRNRVSQVVTEEQNLCFAKKLGTRIVRRFSKSNPIDHLSISLPHCEKLGNNALKQDMLTEDNNRAKRYFSVTDLDDMHDDIMQNKTENEEELLCYVCCERKPNAILENCGHGGICYECAIPLMNKKNKCMHCRSTVETVLKIDPKLKLFDIVKGIESTKVGRRECV